MEAVIADEMDGTLAILAMAQRLKEMLRTGHTRFGRSESTAEHSWRRSAQSGMRTRAVIGAQRHLSRKSMT